MGQMVVSTMHPLAHLAFSDAWPFLNCCRKRKVKGFERQIDDDENLRVKKKKPNLKTQSKNNLSRSMTAKKGDQEEHMTKEQVKEQCLMAKPDLEDYDDPVGFLGFGIVSYFDLIKTLFFLFAILSLVNLPNIMIYKSYGNYADDAVDNFHKTSTLGNLGFTSPKCVDVGMETNNILLSCRTGYIGKITDFGVNAKGEDRSLCRRN